MTTTSRASATWERLRARLAQDGAAVVTGIDDPGARGQRCQVLRDLPSERLQRVDIGALACGQHRPGGGLVRSRHDHGPDEVVVADALEEVEDHSGFKSGRFSASADHSSVALRLNSMAFS